MDHALAGPASLGLKEAAEAAPARPRPKPRGPVLIGDIHTSILGRPLLLCHWDHPEDEP